MRVWRGSRRALLKGAGAAAVGIAASLVIPRMVHALPRAKPHPTWDRLLDHVGQPGEPELRSWVHDLVLRPTRPQRALLLTGPDTNGKTVFHDAMGLLLPEGGVVRMPEDLHYPPLNLKYEWWLRIAFLSRLVYQTYNGQAIQPVG